MKDRNKWNDFRKMVEDIGKEIPMMCCSPDFTHPIQNFEIMKSLSKRDGLI